MNVLSAVLRRFATEEGWISSSIALLAVMVRQLAEAAVFEGIVAWLIRVVVSVEAKSSNDGGKNLHSTQCHPGGYTHTSGKDNTRALLSKEGPCSDRVEGMPTLRTWHAGDGELARSRHDDPILAMNHPGGEVEDNQQCNRKQEI